MTGAYDHVISALRDCVAVMDRDLDGLQVIQPELAKGKKALAELEAVSSEPAQWNGEGLPPVGSIVILDCSDMDIFEDYRQMIGVEVKVEAAFRSRLGVDMVACSLPDGLCGCFRASAAKPLPKPEEIAAEAREKAIAEMVEAIGHFGNLPAASLFATCARLHDAGYQKTTE